MMLSLLHPSAPQPYYYSSSIYPGQRLVYPDETFCSPLVYEPSYTPYLPGVSDASTRYRHALAEYLVAEDEYNAVLRAREEEAVLGACAATFRQEQARLLQARQLEQALAKARAQSLATMAVDYLSLPHVVPVVHSLPKRCGTPLPDDIASRRSRSHAKNVDRAEIWKGLLGPLYESAYQHPAADRKVCGVVILSTGRSNTSDKAQPDHDARRDEAPTLTLERLLHERLQRTFDDDDVQDVARALLRRVGQSAPMGGVSGPSPAASLPEVSRHSYPS
jgi:hypothetical protein